MRSLLLLAPLALLPSCAAPVLKAGARYIIVEPEGDIGVSSTMVSTQNSVEELGIDGSEGSASLYADFKWGSPHLRVSTGSASWDGRGTLSGELSIDDQTILAGADVNSTLDMGVTNATLTFDIIPGSPEFGIGFGVSGLNLAGDFQEVGTNERVEFDETIPFPVLAISAEFELGPIEVGGFASGLSAKVDDDEVSYFDLDIYGAWNFFAGQDSLGGSLTLGWRQVDLDLEYADTAEAVDLSLGFAGPYIGLQLNF